MSDKYVLKSFSQDILPDFNLAASDYAKYRQGFPEEFFTRLMEKNVCDYDANVLDLGTGVGSIARGMAKLGYNTYAIDSAEKLLEEAKKLDKLINVNVHYSHAKAENTKLPDDFFDLVLAGQCWHWFDAEKAIEEIKRITQPNAKLVIAHFDWLPLNNSPAALSEKLIKTFNPDWCLHDNTGFYGQWAMQLAEAGMGNIESYTFTKKRYYSHEEWRGRIRASAGISATLPPEKVKAFDKEHEKLLAEKFPEEKLPIVHRCFTLLADIHHKDFV